MKRTLEHQYPIFLSSLVSDTNEHGSLLVQDYDSQWLSDCICHREDDKAIWRPLERSVSGDFSSVESALGISIHPDIHYLFGNWWSGHIQAQTERGGFDILHAWNEDDFDMLQQNIVGHVLMKQRLKQKVTIFFATTDEDDFILSLDNESGCVLLEQVGCEPQEVLSPDLASFFASASIRPTMFQAQ